jgi:predicted ester cyclase
MIAEGDKVAIRWAARGTHQGELLGIQPTGKQATWTGISIYRFADGKIVEAWWSKDVLGLLQQLGVIPPPEQGGE